MAVGNEVNNSALDGLGYESSRINMPWFCLLPDTEMSLDVVVLAFFFFPPFRFDNHLTIPFHACCSTAFCAWDVGAITAYKKELWMDLCICGGMDSSFALGRLRCVRVILYIYYCSSTKVP